MKKAISLLLLLLTANTGIHAYNEANPVEEVNIESLEESKEETKWSNKKKAIIASGTILVGIAAYLAYKAMGNADVSASDVDLNPDSIDTTALDRFMETVKNIQDKKTADISISDVKSRGMQEALSNNNINIIDIDFPRPTPMHNHLNDLKASEYIKELSGRPDVDYTKNPLAPKFRISLANLYPSLAKFYKLCRLYR